LRLGALYQGFLRAVERGDDETALALFRELPPDSPQRAQGQAPFAAAQGRLSAFHRELAGAALRSGACEEAEGHLAKARELIQREGADLAGRDQRLVQRCRARAASPPAPGWEHQA